MGKSLDPNPKNPTSDDEEETALWSAARLTRLLYFQANPTAPLRPTRSQSQAAAYLTPCVWGTLLGLALDHEISEQQIARVLREKYGIKSNHVQETTWTGVSLARWKDLIRYLRGPTQATTTTTSSTSLALSQAVWSMYLSEMATSKRDILQAFVSAQQQASASGKINILNPHHEIVQAWERQDEDVLRQWESSTTVPSSEKNGRSHNETLLAEWEQLLASNPPDNQLANSSLERLCHAISSCMEGYFVKPVCPNGYYGYDDGPVKPDCVEVAVRELMDLLLWDARTGKFDVTRLPTATVHPVLYSLYEDNSNSNNNNNNNNQPNDETDSTAPQDKGKEWFDALSDLPGCDYLSKSPHGTPYELTPTLRNMAKVVRRLLLHNCNNDDNEEDWDSLVDLQNFWKPHDLQLGLDTLTYRQRDEMVAYEIATVALQAKNAPNAIELKLRCIWEKETGFATVTHLRNTPKPEWLDARALNLLQQSTEENRGVSSKDIWRDYLALAVWGDHGLVSLPSSPPNEDFQAVLRSVMAAPYGLDRRALMQLFATTDLEREERAIHQAVKESTAILTTAIVRVCNFLVDADNSRPKDPATKHDVVAGIQLLAWLLSETPEVVEEGSSASSQRRNHHDPNLETTLLSLPTEILRDAKIRESLAQNPFVRGELLISLVEWKAGNATLLETVSYLGPSKIVPLLWLSRIL